MRQDPSAMVRSAEQALANQSVGLKQPSDTGVNDREGLLDLARRWSGPLLAFVIASVVVGGYYVGVKGESRSAFNRWRPSVRALVNGTDIYQRDAFPTPPIMALILYPFAILPGKFAMAAWLSAKVALTGVVILWLFSTAETGPERFSLPSAFLALALSFRPVMGDYLHGNVNLWILFLIVASLVAFRSGRDGLSGILLALAIACKLTPALLLVYFAWKRAGRLVIACIFGLLVWLIIVPGLFLGVRHNVQLLHHWERQMIRPYVLRGEVDTEQVNQSLPGLVHRLTTNCVAIKPDDGRAPISVHLLELDRSAAQLLVRMLTILTVIGLLWQCRAPITDRRAEALLHEVCLVLITMLVLSERSWKHHYVVLLPSYCFLVGWSARQHASLVKSWSLHAVKWLIGASVLAMTMTSKDLADPLLGLAGSKFMQAYGAYVWAIFALAAAHIICLHCRSCPKKQRSSAPAIVTLTNPCNPRHT